MTIPEFFLLVFLFSAIVACIVYLIYGSFRSGRTMGGVYILYAPPGEGKSYVATHLVLKYLKNNRKTFTNFPVISPDMKYCSNLWQKQFMQKNIYDSAIFIDESYKDYNSREYKTFSKDDHDWFATSGHNQNSVWLLTQNPQRIDTIIREVANFYVFVEKTEIPLLDIPLCFNLYYYRSEEEMRVSKYGFSEPWLQQRIWFNWYVASSYDTRFFRKPAKNIYEGKTWFDVFKEKDFVFVPPVPSGIAWLKIQINRLADKALNYMMDKIPWDVGKRLDRNLDYEVKKEEEKKLGEEMFKDDNE